MLRHPSGPASKQSGPGEEVGRRPRVNRGRFRATSWEALEARELLAHGTITTAIARQPAASRVSLGSAASRTPPVDRALETRFLEGVHWQVVGITPSPGVIASYLTMLEKGVPRDRVLERLLESSAALGSTVTGAYRLLLHRDPRTSELEAMTTVLRRGGDPRALLVSIASSREYYNRRGGGTEASFLGALDADGLGPTTRPGGTGRMGLQARSSLVRALVFSEGFHDRWLEAVARSTTGAYIATSDLIVRARNVLRRPGGMTRTLALMLASDSARVHLARGEVEGNPPRTTAPSITTRAFDRVDFTDLATAGSAQRLTVPTKFGDAVDFDAVSYVDTLSGQSAPTVALPEGLINKAGNRVTYELWFNAQTSGALLQLQLNGNNQTFDVPILAINADGKLRAACSTSTRAGNSPRGLPAPAPARSRRPCPTR